MCLDRSSNLVQVSHTHSVGRYYQQLVGGAWHARRQVASPLALLQENIADSFSRYPMVFTDSVDTTLLLQYTGLRDPLVLVGSDFEGDLNNAYDYAKLREVGRSDSLAVSADACA